MANFAQISWVGDEAVRGPLLGRWPMTI